MNMNMRYIRKAKQAWREQNDRALELTRVLAIMSRICEYEAFFDIWEFLEKEENLEKICEEDKRILKYAYGWIEWHYVDSEVETEEVLFNRIEIEYENDIDRYFGEYIVLGIIMMFCHHYVGAFSMFLETLVPLEYEKIVERIIYDSEKMYKNIGFCKKIYADTMAPIYRYKIREVYPEINDIEEKIYKLHNKEVRKMFLAEGEEDENVCALFLICCIVSKECAEWLLMQMDEENKEQTIQEMVNYYCSIDENNLLEEVTSDYYTVKRVITKQFMESWNRLRI